MQETCWLVDQWLKQSAHHAFPTTPPEALIIHSQGCPRCRTLLVALAVKAAQLPTDVANQPCAQIEDALPAFVDDEQLYGHLVAARTDPAVWWHTLTCRRCADLAHSLRALAALPQRPWSPSIKQPRPVAMSYPQIQLPLARLRMMAGVDLRLGPAWGESDAETLLAEAQADLGSLRLVLRRGPAGELLLVVQTDPPITGVARLSVNGNSYSEPLATDGCATFAGLDETLFHAHDRGRLLLSIDPGEGGGRPAS